MAETEAARGPVLFIVNPIAGGGRARRAGAFIRALAVRHPRQVDVVETARPGDAETLARQGASTYAVIAAVGGDGTLQEVANGLLSVGKANDGDAASALGVVPVGRGNDFARTLGIPTDTTRAADVVLARGVPARHDAARCRERFFLCAGGVGFDGEVAAKAGRARGRLAQGKAAYVLTTLLELRRYRNRDVTVEIDGRRLERRVLLVAVANTRFYGGGMMICPRATTDDGLLDVCIVGDVSRSEALGQLPGLFSGRHARHPKVEFHRARAVRIEAAADTKAHLDGEVVAGPPLEFAVAPSALTVIVPRH